MWGVAGDCVPLVVKDSEKKLPLVRSQRSEVFYHTVNDHALTVKLLCS